MFYCFTQLLHQFRHIVHSKRNINWTSVNTVQHLPFFLCSERLCKASSSFCLCWKEECRILCRTHLSLLLLFLKEQMLFFFFSSWDKLNQIKDQKCTLKLNWHNVLKFELIFHKKCNFNVTLLTYLWWCFYHSAPAPPRGLDHYCLLPRIETHGQNPCFWRTRTFCALGCFSLQKMRHLNQKQPGCLYILFKDQRKGWTD